MNIKNPFFSLAAGLQDRIKSAFVVMQAKFQSESDRLKIELRSLKNDLQKTKEQLHGSEELAHSLREENEELTVKTLEIKKAWLLLQSTSANVAKIQQLIEAYKRVKIELLELRKQSDCSLNDFDGLQQENNKMKLLLANLSADGKVDVNALLDTISTLKKENTQYKSKCENLERLVKSIKKNEEKLLNTIKAKQVL